MAAFPAADIRIHERVGVGRGRWLVLGEVTNVTTSGGHVPKAALDLDSIQTAHASQRDLGAQSLQFVPNSQNGVDDNNAPGDLWLDPATITSRCAFLVLGVKG